MSGTIDDLHHLAPRIGEFNLDATTESVMRERHRVFVAQAFEQLAIA